MNILIKSATIVDPKSEFHNSTQDVLIENGVITAIAISINNPKNYKEIKLDNLHISQGWFDSSVSFGEPGFEERETIVNGLKTAALSGFTAVALNPNSNPVIDSNSDITFVNSKSNKNAVSLLPIGALTVDSKGEYLAELYDMSTAGAVAFYDYKKPISNPNLMKIALQYASNFDGLVCSFPQENKIAGSGVMNENITSTKLGLKGIPALAEELQVARDLFLLEYTGGKLHIPTISTASSVALIRAAKQNKLDVTFANEQEIIHLIGAKSFDEVLDFGKNLGKLLVITRSDKGSVAIHNSEVFECESEKNLTLVDLTGAGDLFAAGFLHGHINKMSTQESLQKGTEMASKIIQKIGARLN